MSVARRQPGPATLDDLLAIPEDVRRHELIDGEIVDRGAASGKHGATQGRIFRALGPFDRRPGGRSPGGWIFATDVEIFFDLKKKRVYHEHRVPHDWIADPLEETLAVYRWSPDGYVEVLTTERGERVRAEPFADVELVVGVLFGDDPEE